MKTKLSFFTLAFATLFLSFSSCSNSDDAGGIDNTTKSVFLKLGKSSSTTTTRSVSDPVDDGDEVILNSGDLYFVNASGAILRHYTISSSQTSPTNISISDITSGASITNLPGNTTTVYVVGNSSGLPTSGNISAVREYVLEVTDQADIEEVNLYGSGDLVPPATSGPHTCVVDLKATVARIELTDITTSGVITAFSVDGIFVDSYYAQASADGTTDPGNLVENGADADAFDNLSPEYPVELKPAIYDFYDTPLAASSLVAKPAGSGTVWGYNLFAGSTVPRVIIRLSNIATSDGSTYSSPQFITIRGFKTVSGGTPLTSIAAGSVYNIAAGALVFKETDLSPIPNLNLIDVEVSINVIDWSVVGVTPEL